MPKEQRTYASHFSNTCRNRAKARRGSHHFQTGKYKRQWQRTAANKKRRLKRHLSLHPEDIQTLKALRKLIA